MTLPLKALEHELQQHLLGAPSAISAEVIDAPPLPVEERLGIYRNAYRVRLIDALHEVYPVLHALLGDEVFFELGAAFVAAHASPYRSIRWYGREMPAYLAHRAPFDEQPILAEVALLEWTLSEVFDAPDALSVGRQELTQLTPDAWEHLRMRFHPSLRTLELRYNTTAVWQAMMQEEAPPAPQAADAPVPWLLWRQDFKNYFRSLEHREAALLDAARSGASFAELCERLGEWLPDEEVPLAAANYMNSWVVGGLIISLDT